MMELDLKDRKILYQLDVDARQSFAQLGRKVGLSKNTIAYRIKKLEEEGVIRGFYTVINPHKLGYITPRFHFVYQYSTPAIKKEITNYFTQHPHTMIVASTKGTYDLSAMFCIEHCYHLYNIWKEIQNKYSYYFQEQVFSFWIGEIRYKPSYLITDDQQKNDRVKTRNIGTVRAIELDDLEISILKLIAPHARMAITDIADSLDVTSTVVQYRINKLLKLGIIQGFEANYNLAKLGYNLFKVNLHLSDYKKRNDIIRYVQQNPYLYCTDDSACEAHLELEFHLPQLGELHELMEDVITQFPNAIKNYDYFSVTDVHKYLYMPIPQKRYQL